MGAQQEQFDPEQRATVDYRVSRHADEAAAAIVAETDTTAETTKARLIVVIMVVVEPTPLTSE